MSEQTRGEPQWEDWRELLQVVANAESKIIEAYRLSTEKGAWVDGDGREGVRAAVQEAARDYQKLFDRAGDDEKATEFFQTLARPRIQKAIQSAEGLFPEHAGIMRDLESLSYRASVVDQWRELRCSIRLALDNSTARAGVERVAPARVVLQARSKKVGRNAPCPCGSGKKYKKCCGR